MKLVADLCVGTWMCVCIFCFKQKSAYELRVSDWSSDVCSSGLIGPTVGGQTCPWTMGAGSAGVMDNAEPAWAFPALVAMGCRQADINSRRGEGRYHGLKKGCRAANGQPLPSVSPPSLGSEEPTSELQSLIRISYAVLSLKKKKQ